MLRLCFLLFQTLMLSGCFVIIMVLLFYNPIVTIPEHEFGNRTGTYILGDSPLGIVWFAQVTDMHFGKNEAIFPSFQSFINEVIHGYLKPYRLLITGDIAQETQLGLQSSRNLTSWKEYNESIFSLGKDRCKFVLDIRGNHDAAGTTPHYTDRDVYMKYSSCGYLKSFLFWNTLSYETDDVNNTANGNGKEHIGFVMMDTPIDPSLTLTFNYFGDISNQRMLSTNETRLSALKTSLVEYQGKGNNENRANVVFLATHHHQATMTIRMKKMMERLMVKGYWDDGQLQPDKENIETKTTHPPVPNIWGVVSGHAHRVEMERFAAERSGLEAELDAFVTTRAWRMFAVDHGIVGFVDDWYVWSEELKARLGMHGHGRIEVDVEEEEEENDDDDRKKRRYGHEIKESSLTHQHHPLQLKKRTIEIQKSFFGEVKDAIRMRRNEKRNDFFGREVALRMKAKSAKGASSNHSNDVSTYPQTSVSSAQSAAFSGAPSLCTGLITNPPSARQTTQRTPMSLVRNSTHIRALVLCQAPIHRVWIEATRATGRELIKPESVATRSFVVDGDTPPPERGEGTEIINLTLTNQPNPENVPLYVARWDPKRFSDAEFYRFQLHAIVNEASSFSAKTSTQNAKNELTAKEDVVKRHFIFAPHPFSLQNKGLPLMPSFGRFIIRTPFIEWFLFLELFFSIVLFVVLLCGCCVKPAAKVLLNREKKSIQLKMDERMQLWEMYKNTMKIHPSPSDLSEAEEKDSTCITDGSNVLREAGNESETSQKDYANANCVSLEMKVKEENGPNQLSVNICDECFSSNSESQANESEIEADYNFLKNEDEKWLNCDWKDVIVSVVWSDQVAADEWQQKREQREQRVQMAIEALKKSRERNGKIEERKGEEIHGMLGECAEDSVHSSFSSPKPDSTCTKSSHSIKPHTTLSYFISDASYLLSFKNSLHFQQIQIESEKLRRQRQKEKICKQKKHSEKQRPAFPGDSSSSASPSPSLCEATHSGSLPPLPLLSLCSPSYLSRLLQLVILNFYPFFREGMCAWVFSMFMLLFISIGPLFIGRPPEAGWMAVFSWGAAQNGVVVVQEDIYLMLAVAILLFIGYPLVLIIAYSNFEPRCNCKRRDAPKHLMEPMNNEKVTSGNIYDKQTHSIQPTKDLLHSVEQSDHYVFPPVPSTRSAINIFWMGLLFVMLDVICLAFLILMGLTHPSFLLSPVAIWFSLIALSLQIVLAVQKKRRSKYKKTNSKVISHGE